MIKAAAKVSSHMMGKVLRAKILDLIDSEKVYRLEGSEISILLATSLATFLDKKSMNQVQNVLKILKFNDN